MDLWQVNTKLEEALNLLTSGTNMVWHVPPATPENPLEAAIDPSWPTWTGNTFNGNSFYPSPSNPGPLRRFEKNYVYAEFTVPQQHAGLDLARSEAMLFIHGWIPFTLWLDGQELYREEHAWHATGPLADAWPIKIEPGKTHRVVVCLEPTDLPTGYQFWVDVKYRNAIDLLTPLGVASQALVVANKLLKAPADRRKLEKAAALLDLDALARQDWPAVLASLERFTKAMAFFAPRMKQLVVHLVGHTHIDMDWMWTWPDTVHCIRRDFKSVLDMMDDIPEICFTHSQVPTYKVIQEMDPDLFKRVQQRIAEGRWEVAAGTWVEGDLNMADGEDLVRHMLYASDWCKANLGKQAEVFWAPDTFGHPGNMPQLAALGEMNHYFHWRGQLPGQWQPVRRWSGVDGTTVTAASQSYGAWILPHNLWQKAATSWERGLKNALFIWGLGDHGGGLPRWCHQLVMSVKDHPLMPTIRFSTMKQYFAAVAAEKTTLPVSKGETQTLFAGCFTTHASIKTYNRRCETALLTAETLATLAGIDSRPPLGEAWQKMLFNHFHDIMDGAAVHGSYENAHARAEAALSAAATVSQQAMQALIKPAKGQLVLVNPLGFDRTEPVCVELPEGTTCLIDDKGAALPVQKLDDKHVFIARDVPAWGSRTYKLATKRHRTLQVTDATVTENAHQQTFVVQTQTATISVSKNNGTIGSFIDKASGRELVPYGVPRDLEHVYTVRQDLAMNLFQVIDEQPNAMTAWLVNSHTREENLIAGAKVSVVEAGPVFARLRVEHAFRSSSIRQDIVVYNQLLRVDLDMTIDWRERGNPDIGVPQLKLSFNGNVPATKARFEGPFVVAQRPADGTDQPTQKFVDVSGEGAGYTILNDSKYGADVLGSRCRVTLLRNPYSPDGEPDNGVHRIRLAVVPHGGDVANDALVRAGMGFNRPMLAAAGKAASVRSGARFRLDAPGVVASALRQAEHSEGILVRLVETCGRRTKGTVAIAGGIHRALEVNFLEKPMNKPLKVSRGRLELSWRPFEVKTLLLEL